MRKKFFCIIILCLLLLTSCSKSNDIDINNQNNNNSNNINEPQKSNESITEELKILSITTPNDLNTLINQDTLVNIEHKNHLQEKIEIEFNQNITDDNYIIGYYRNGDYLSVKNDFDINNNVYYKYEINNNIMTIIPYNDCRFDGDFHAVYIPMNIKSENESYLKNDKLFVISNFRNENIYADNEKYELSEKRSFYSKAIIKNKDDGISLGYINKNDSYIYPSKNKDNGALGLYFSENVIILDEKDDFYYVKMHFNKNFDEGLNNFGFEIEDEVLTKSIKGYIKKSDISLVAEPYSKNASYLVTYGLLDSMEQEPVITYIIINKLGQELSSYINTKANSVEENDLHILEATVLSNWMYKDYVIPCKYLDTYMDNIPEDGKFNKSYHNPEINWTDKEYNTYSNASKLYKDNILDIIKTIDIMPNMDGYCEDIKEQIEFRYVLNDIWIDWAYKDKLNNDNYFFDEIFNRLSLSEEKINSINSILANTELEFEENKKEMTISDTAAKAMLFENKIYDLYNKFNYEGGIKQFNNYLGEILEKKYLYDVNYSLTTYKQMKSDAVEYYIKLRNEQNEQQLLEEQRIQAVIDFGSDITEVDKVFSDYINLSDAEKLKINDATYTQTPDYTHDLVICTVEEKQCVKGVCEILLKIKVNSIRSENTKLEVDKVYNLIYVRSIYDAKDSINMGDKLRLAATYKNDNTDVLYFDFWYPIFE